MTSKKKFIIFGAVFCFAIVCCSFLCRKASKSRDLSIVFSKSGNVSEYNISGFSQLEEGHAWTDGEFASVKVPVPEIGKDKFFRVLLDAAPFVGKRLKKQIVGVFVNDEFVTNFIMTGSDVYKFELPRDLQKSGNIANINFKISNPTSPKDLRLSGDTRKLGMSVKKMTFAIVDANNPDGFAEYKIGKIIGFEKGGNSEQYIASGWGRAETGHTWTNGKDAYLNLFVKDVEDKQLRLSVVGHAVFGPNDNSQKVTVFVNGKELTVWEVGKENGTYAVKLPESVVQKGALQIRLHINKPIKIKQDPRDLGMAVNTVKISQIFAAKTKNKLANWFKNKVADDSESGQATENNK